MVLSIEFFIVLVTLRLLVVELVVNKGLLVVELVVSVTGGGSRNILADLEILSQLNFVGLLPSCLVQDTPAFQNFAIIIPTFLSLYLIQPLWDFSYLPIQRLSNSVSLNRNMCNCLLLQAESAVFYISGYAKRR